MSEIEVTLSNAELAEKCKWWASELARTGGKAWCLSIPPRFNIDPDILICEAADRLNKMEADAVTFAEWILEKGYYSYVDITRMWCRSIPIRNNTVYTTEQLYELFKNRDK